MSPAILLGLALVGQPAPVPTLAAESYTLPNGLKVVLHRDPSVPRVTVCVAYHVGSKNERAGRTGFAHFFEHMMFRGTKNVPNYDIPLQETGAQSNAFTSEDMTVYFETVPSDYLDRALYLEAERLAFLPSALEQEKFDTEREVVKNERRQSYENVPYGLAEEAILARVFPTGHPYSWSVIGSMRDLDAATLADLRQFFAEFYHPGNAALCLAGDFDPAKARESIARYFTPIPAGPPVQPVTPAAAKLTAPAGATLVDRVSLPRLYLAWPTVKDDDPDAPALGLLGTILANGEASRLYRALVKGAKVANAVDATSDTKEAAGLFTIDATAAEGRTLDELATALDAALADLATNPPTAAELARALPEFERGTVRGLTSPLRRATLLATTFVEKGDPNAYQADYARYYRVAPADLARVAAKYLTPERVRLTIVPAKAEEAKTAATVAGPNPGPAAPAVKPTDPDAIKGGAIWTTMPGPSPSTDWRAPRVVRRTLSNGVDLRVVPWRTLPIVEARLVIPVGSGDDPAGKEGLADLTATLLDKGTTTKTADELTEALERLGVALGVGASGDSTMVSISALARNLAPALELVGEVLTAPRFDPADFERERKLALDGLLQGPDSPGWIAGRAFRALLYGPDHPYGRPADGSAESVRGLTLDDVRGFHARYAADRATLIVVGDVDPDRLVADLEAGLGPWRTTGPKPSPRLPSSVGHEPGTVFLADKPGAVQSVIQVGRRWGDRVDPTYDATVIGNHVLGADFLSRLNANLREKNGYTYGCGSNFGYRRTGSVWQVRTSVRADVTAEALKEILGELDGLASARPLTEGEIAVGREAEVRSFPDSFEEPAGIAGVLIELAQFGLPDDYLDGVLGRLRRATDAQIRRAMVEVVAPDARTILIVGDRRAIEPKLRALGFAKIQAVTPDGRPAP